MNTLTQRIGIQQQTMLACFSPKSVRWLLLLSAIVGITIIPVTMTAQTIPFTCRPYEIRSGIVPGVIAPCDTSVVFYMGQPIPIKSPSATAESPVKMRLTLSSAHGFDSLVDMDYTTTIDRVEGTIEIHPNEPFPVFVGDDPQPMLYEFIFDCKWWDPESITDSVRMYVSKQNVHHYRTEARSLKDSSLLGPGITPPDGEVQQHATNTPVVFGIHEVPPDYVFSHWTSSYAGVQPVPNEPTQQIVDACWPLTDTVVFTAWLELVTDVPDVNTSAVDVIWSHTYQQLSIRGLGARPAIISVYDVRGLLDAEYRIDVPEPNTQLLLSLKPGVHLAIIKQGNAVRVAHFLAY